MGLFYIHFAHPLLKRCCFAWTTLHRLASLCSCVDVLFWSSGTTSCTGKDALLPRLCENACGPGMTVSMWFVPRCSRRWDLGTQGYTYLSKQTGQEACIMHKFGITAVSHTSSTPQARTCFGASCRSHKRWELT